MRNLLIVVVAACVLSACGAPRSGRSAVATYGPACKEIGFEPETPEYKQCVLHLWQQHANRINAIMNAP